MSKSKQMVKLIKEQHRRKYDEWNEKKEKAKARQLLFKKMILVDYINKKPNLLKGIIEFNPNQKFFITVSALRYILEQEWNVPLPPQDLKVILEYLEHYGYKRTMYSSRQCIKGIWVANVKKYELLEHFVVGVRNNHVIHFKDGKNVLFKPADRTKEYCEHCGSELLENKTRSDYERQAF